MEASTLDGAAVKIAIWADVYAGESTQEDSTDWIAEAREVDCAPLSLGVDEGKKEEITEPLGRAGWLGLCLSCSGVEEGLTR